MMSKLRSLGLVIAFSGLVASACSNGSDRPATGQAGAAPGAGAAGNGGGAGSTGVAGAPSGEAGDVGTSGLAGAGGAGATDAGAAGNAGATPDAGADATTDADVHIDAGHGDATSGCPYLFCDDFEGVAPGATGSAWALDLDKKGTVLETVSDKGKSGTHSVHVKMSEMAGVFGYITETKTLAATGASFWGRVFIWYAVATPNVHIVNVAVDGTMANAQSEQVRIVNVIGSHIATNRRSDDMGKGSNVAPPSGMWGCYEWHITPDSLDVYLDGTKLPISETWTEPKITLLRMGFERFSAGAAGDVWLDDVAINDSQIGCQ